MLGHSLNLGTHRLRKGHWLDHTDVESLVEAGVSTIFAGAPEDGDVLEDDAARYVAQLAAGLHVMPEKPHTGRCNLVAQRDGVIVYDRDTLVALNLVDEKITLALVPPYSTVRCNDLIGTVKIIPFAVQKALLDQCGGVFKESELCQVAPFLDQPCALLETRLRAVKPLSEKILGFTRARIERVGLTLTETSACAHTPADVSEWLSASVANGQNPGVLLVFGASATVDEEDVIPAAIRLAGGTVERVGMAADPGNLLVYGRLGKVIVIGLPGCAKSPALNGFDWVLERAAAGLPISQQDWAEMSVGGLLKEIEARPQLRRPAQDPQVP